jgi:hypothetical protein
MLGTCCPGLLDAQGRCCWASVDECGVCNGNNECITKVCTTSQPQMLQELPAAHNLTSEGGIRHMTRPHWSTCLQFAIGLKSGPDMCINDGDASCTPASPDNMATALAALLLLPAAAVGAALLTSAQLRQAESMISLGTGNSAEYSNTASVIDNSTTTSETTEYRSSMPHGRSLAALPQVNTAYSKQQGPALLVTIDPATLSETSRQSWEKTAVSTTTLINKVADMISSDFAFVQHPNMTIDSMLLLYREV